MKEEILKMVLMSAYNVNMLSMKNVQKRNLNVISVIKETVKKENLSAHNVNMLLLKNFMMLFNLEQDIYQKHKMMKTVKITIVMKSVMMVNP